jgi:UDP-N-acetylglucosamine:LPS N-acetylglucosamine transferase
LRDALGALLQQKKPDVIVSTYPVYGHLIAELFRENPNRPFRLITVITDSISVCSAWYLASSDFFVVADEPTSEVLRRAGVASAQIKALGFPVSPVFARRRPMSLARPGDGQPPKVLYVINTGKPLVGRSLDGLLQIEGLQLTITTGRSASLKARLERRLRDFGPRVRIHGWTDEMPELLMSHHLLIGKAGGAMVHEALAARCPMIINQVIPGQEEGNARLVEALGAGAVVAQRDVAKLVEQAFDGDARLWQQWRDNLEKVSQPDSALRIAELILAQFPRGEPVIVATAR